jgi:hypothetical protein
MIFFKAAAGLKDAASGADCFSNQIILNQLSFSSKPGLSPDI